MQARDPQSETLTGCKLCHPVLIDVTSFGRDPEAWDTGPGHASRPPDDAAAVLAR